MPDPVITPAVSPVPVSNESIKPEPPAYVPPASEGTAMSQNMAGSILMPEVVFKHPPVAGENIIDRGGKAEFIVMHRRFGDFPGGSRISSADIVNPADIDALIKIGTLQAIPKAEPAEPAKSESEPPKKGK